MTQMSAWRWQQVSRMSDTQFDLWVKPFLNGNVSKGDELTFSRLYGFCRGKQERDSIEREVKLTDEGWALYKALLALKGATIGYIRLVIKRPPPLDELRFILRNVGKIINGLREAGERINQLVSKEK
jgi:hypothetical protein